MITVLVTLIYATLSLLYTAACFEMIPKEPLFLSMALAYAALAISQWHK